MDYRNGADRTPYICQSQSINLYLSADIDKWDLMMLHWKAWELGIKSLYYCRSKSIQRASFAGVEADNTSSWPEKIFLKLKRIMKNVCHVNKLKGKKWIVLMKNKLKSGPAHSSNSYKPFRYPWAYDFGKDTTSPLDA